MWLALLFLLALVILLACIFAIFSLERYVLFQPTSEISTSFDEKYTDYTVRGVNCWHFKRGSSRIIFYCHGNTGNISHRKYAINMSKHLGVDLLLFDYRGFGSSERIGITQKTIVEDSDVAFRSILDKYPVENVIIWGESLGSKPASYLASKYSVGRLVILMGFSSLEDAVNDGMSFPWNTMFSSVVKYTFRDNSANKNYLRRVKCPVMIIHSIEDELIPYQNAIKNIRSVGHSNKILVSIKGTHSSPSIEEDKIVLINHFLNPSRPLHKSKLSLIRREIEAAADLILIDPHSGSELTEMVKLDDNWMEQFKIKNNLFPNPEKKI